MKRGFLLRAEEKKTAANRRGAQKQAVPSSSSTPATTTEPHPVPKGSNVEKHSDVLPQIEKMKLAYGNLSEEEKALPGDYDPSKTKTNIKETSASTTDYAATTRVVTTIPQPVPEGETQCEWIVNGPTKAKVVKAPGYPALIPKPRLRDLYEVRSTPDMGKGVFAKCNIKRGELIFAERPLLVAPVAIVVPALQELPKHYTEQQIKQIMMLEHEKYLEYCIGRLSNESQVDFRALHNAHTGDGSGPLLGVIRSNSYVIGNLYDGPVKTPHGKYQAVCKLASRLNHSCLPNVRYRFKINSFSIQFYAIRDIQAGEQLLYAYCLLQATTAQRQAELAPYGFVCKCQACVDASPENDILRTTAGIQLARLINILQNSPQINEAVLEEAVRLEKDMVNSVLHVDLPVDFLMMLGLIGLGYTRLMNQEKGQKYLDRAEAFQKCFRVGSDD